HVVGDIFDRGAGPEKIMVTVIDYDAVEIQRRNHDELLLGGYAGSTVCLGNVVEIGARYKDLKIVEDSYGLYLLSLFTLADKYYDDKQAFQPKKTSGKPLTEDE